MTDAQAKGEGSWGEGSVSPCAVAGKHRFHVLDGGSSALSILFVWLNLIFQLQFILSIILNEFQVLGGDFVKCVTV